jgi:hypothetical protein
MIAGGPGTMPQDNAGEQAHRGEKAGQNLSDMIGRSQPDSPHLNVHTPWLNRSQM